MRAFSCRLLILTAICLTVSLNIQAEEAAKLPAYAKGANWQSTMIACRAACQAAQVQFPAVMGPWWTTEGLRVNGFADTAFSEKGTDVTAKDPAGKGYWQLHEDYADYTFNNLPGGDSSAVYLCRKLTTEKAFALTVGVRGDDGIDVWLNGEKLFSKEGTDAGPLEVVLPLKAGENNLLLRAFNKTGTNGFYFNACSDPSNMYWSAVSNDFREQTYWMFHDSSVKNVRAWFMAPDNTGVVMEMIARALDKQGTAGQPIQQAAQDLKDGKAGSDDARWLDLYLRAVRFRGDMLKLSQVNFEALRRTVQDLGASFPDKYTKTQDYLNRIAAAEQALPEIQNALGRGEDAGTQRLQETLALQREALMANPLLNFDKLLLVKRADGNLGLPQNWQGNCAMSMGGYDNEIATLSMKDTAAGPATLFRPQQGEFVGDVDLHFDGGKMLFSMPGSNKRWQIWEMNADATGLRQVTPGTEPDVDNYDPCYLPNEKIIFASTRCFQGVPCVGGSNTVANFCLMDAQGQNIRQLCFDQDHNWCPTVLNNGRVMFSRWEYSDTPHYFSRILFHMNPDGTNQTEYYGSNSYWPNSIFYARPIPNSPSKVVAVISGHHGVPRMGELIVFDAAKGRFEGEGVMQRIPGYGKKVEPIITDQLVDGSWPKFLHPYPLSDKYFLVSCKPSPDVPWGIYLVDVFDNMLLLSQQTGYALFEPLPFRATERPPVIPDKVKLDKQEANVYLADIYAGQGLKGVPKGSVKKLRVYEIYYCYPQMGGHVNIGVEGPWDAHRILGTVPVYEDGSAYFTVPSNIPIAVQPLDEQGRALQIMRSWFTAMPGESVSCVGCHERQNMAAPPAPAMAARHEPTPIEPWKGPARGFDFKRDVQPVLDKFCVGCHDGADRPDGSKIPNLARRDKNGWGNFTPSYLALHPYVRRPGPESDYHIQVPLEFHASTSQLIRLLKKGHHGVKLDDDAWERLYAWIDLNVPDHGTWGEQDLIKSNFHQRRLEMRTQYANRPEDPEVIPDLKQEPVSFIKPEEPKLDDTQVTTAGWPFDPAQAAAMQNKAGQPARRTVDLGNGVTMELALIPAGTFIMGSNEGTADERPCNAVRIDRPFWMGTVEITNAQFKQFDPQHDNGYIDQHSKDHTTPGYSIQDPNFPAVRISWEQAEGFCRWLSEKTGSAFALPTEAQWEWACRAGSASSFSYGTMDTDFSAFANLADQSIKLLAVSGINPQPIDNPGPNEDFLPKDTRFNDGAKIMTAVAKYQPNGWGLYDMHGNAAEWTMSAYSPYPYLNGDGRDDPAAKGKKVVRGGSWMDRPKDARSAARWGYEPWQCVYNVSFRVVCPADAKTNVADSRR